jgi:hypothetical protein
MKSPFKGLKETVFFDFIFRTINIFSEYIFVLDDIVELDLMRDY